MIEALARRARDHRHELVPEARDVLGGEIRAEQRESFGILGAGARAFHQWGERRAPAPEDRVEVPELRIAEHVVVELVIELLRRNVRTDVRALPPLARLAVLRDGERLE